MQLKPDKRCKASEPPAWLQRELTGAWHYEPGDRQLWHTNWQNPGQRCYLVWSENGESGMNFVVGGEVRQFCDLAGWQYRIFDVPQPHAVWANCERISYGWPVSGMKQNREPIQLEDAQDILQIA